MRFFEIAQARRAVVMTKRFERELKGFLKADAAVGRNLAEFLRFRETAPATQNFGKKDSVYTGKAIMQRFRHVHLIHGKVILTYQLTPSEIRLCAITDHKASETSTVFANYLGGLDAGDFRAIAAAEAAPEPALSPEQRQGVIETLYDLAGHPDDRQMLTRTAEGAYDPTIWEMLRGMIGLDGPEKEANALIVKAFGGVDAFRAKVREILGHTGG